MNNLIIIGARGFGREVYSLFKACHGNDEDWNCLGFLDSKSDALIGYENYPPIIDSPTSYVPRDGDLFVCALGDPKYKKEYVELMLEKGAHFTNLIHPYANINSNAKIGKGCLIFRDTDLSADVRLGDFVTITSKSIIGHDAEVQNYCHIGSMCFMGGFSILEEGCNMFPGSQILPHKRAGEWSIIGAGSVVIKNVKPNTTVFGNPAKQL